MIKEITSLQNSYIKELVSLKSSKAKKEKNTFLIEGEDLVSLAYETKQLDLIIALEKQNEYLDVNQLIVTKPILEKLSNNKSLAKVIGVAHYEKKSIMGNKVIYLDNVQDPGNVGTIIRTALSFSYSGLVLSDGSASIYNEKVIQASKGGVFKLPILENVKLDELKNKGYQIVSTALHGAKNYLDVNLDDKFVLVFGNEGQGISEEILKMSDMLIKIDMDHIDSLNVAIAAGILMNHYRG